MSVSATSVEGLFGNNLHSPLQASPSDPENFPFVVIGNKIDVDGGNSRVVSLDVSIHDVSTLLALIQDPLIVPHVLS